MKPNTIQLRSNIKVQIVKTLFYQPVFGSFLHLLVLLQLFGFVQIAKADNTVQPNAAPNAEQTQIEARKNQLNQIVIGKLKFYATHFPNIDFVVLDSAGDSARNMQILSQIIGEEPEPLDYEHPGDLRHQLLMVTLMRIRLLLDTDAGSATLFKPGKNALAKRKYVCVITIDPWAIAKDNRAATRHLLELTDTEFATIPLEHYLDAMSHLQFAFDHEVFHCLDTLYNGPMAMSQQQYWADFNFRKDEAGADAFGVIMNLANHSSRTSYAQTLQYIRGLTLLGNDPNHYTAPAIAAVLQLDPTEFAGDDIHAHIQIASQIRDRIIGNYADYVQYAIAANHAMKQLGIKNLDMELLGKTADSRLVTKLLESTHQDYRKLTGHVLPTAK